MNLTVWCESVSFQGDLIKKEKLNISLEKMIKKIKTRVKVNHRENIVLLEKEFKTITINKQVGLNLLPYKELSAV